jgi:putative transposase
MADYRRAFVPGGSFFFTVVTERRAPIFRDDTARRFLGAAFRECRHRWPFRLDALVLLDDHLHAMWTLPPNDTRYSARWGFIKKEFTKTWLAAAGYEQPRSNSRLNQRRRGVWQRRFWEHTLRDENDYARHFDYVHYNPVKHGYVERVRDWPHSTFHRWVNQGVYALNWGCDGFDSSAFDNLDITAME